MTALVGAALVAVPTCVAATGPTLATFATWGAHEWTVPAGVTRVTFDVYGAQGGASHSFPGGLGGRSTVTLTVSPGTTYQIDVGQMGMADALEGDPSFNGGGASNGTGGAGGGATDIRTGGYTLAERLIVAGGGGGTASYVSNNPVDGGATLLGGAGGSGGGLEGAAGEGPAPGGGGTQTAAGAGGVGSGTAPSGDGAVGGQGQGGGGGGGGYFGGGGGADVNGGNDVTSGGGGGSGYGPTGTSFQSGVHSGDGLVVITIPAAYRPDGMVKRATTTDSYVGNNVYNTTGTNQSRSWSSVRGYDRSFDLRFQNDGNVADSFRLKGCSASTGFSVRYQSGGSVITSTVTSGSYTTSTLQPGGATTITLVIHVKSAATIGAIKRCMVTATSVTRSTKADTLRATLEVVRR